MTEFLSSLTFSPRAAVVAVPSYDDNINRIWPPVPRVKVIFTATPALGAFVYVVGSTIVVGGETYPMLTPITFTASVTIPFQLKGRFDIVEYYWNFGDDTFGYGETIAHTYKILNRQVQCVLRATDNRGDYWYYRKQIYLEEQPLVFTGGALSALK